MSIGETLVRARRDAGLSIAKTSIRAHVKRGVIERVERDDYSACGGHAGARRDITALARALRVDAVPLVQAYDAAQHSGQWIGAATPPAPWHGQVTASEDGDTLPIPMSAPPDPVTAGEPPSRFTSATPPEGTAGELFQPVTFAWASELDEPMFASAGRRWVPWIGLLAMLLAVGGFGGILFAAGISGQPAPHAAAAGRHRVLIRPERTRQPSHAHSASLPGPARPASPASGPAARALIPAGIAAFGPGGTSHGDSPQLARQALTGSNSAPWHSAWYTTEHFGNLQSGTGLLLDMGREVTITSARIVLGPSPGADFTLRIGDAPALASLRPAAHADHAGGVVRLTTAPTRGRYVLVWFTTLPPDQAGTFQVSVSDITLRGYP